MNIFSIYGAGFLLHLAAIVVGTFVLLRFGGNAIVRWIVLILGCGVAFMAFQLSAPQQRFFDFSFAYYPAGEALLRHDHAALRALTGPAFVNVPIVAYLFMPFARVGLEWSEIAFTYVGVSLVGFAWGLLCRVAQLEARERWLLGLAFLLNGPLIDGIKFGNSSYYVLFGLVAGLYLIRRDRTRMAGVLLGAAAVIKPPLLLFGLLFVLRADMPGLVGFSLTCSVVGLLSLGIFGWADNYHWFQSCIALFGYKWLAGFAVQSIPAFIYRLYATPAILLNWAPQVPTHAEMRWAETSFALIFGVAMLACLKRPSVAPVQRDGDQSLRLVLQYLLIMTLCIVTSPLAWSHYYAWFLIPAAFFLKARLRLSLAMRWLGWASAALITPLIMWPVSSVSSSNAVLMKAYSSVLVSHLLLGGLLWFAFIAWWLSLSGSGSVGISASLELHGTPCD